MNIKFSSRLVVILKKYVIKIPINKRGYLQGKNEKYLHKKYKHLNLLANLKYEFLGIVIMQKYRLTNKIDATNVFNIKSQIKELNIKNCDLYNYENWGIDNDKKILIDYGITEYISTLY